MVTKTDELIKSANG